MEEQWFARAGTLSYTMLAQLSCIELILAQMESFRPDIARPHPSHYNQRHPSKLCQSLFTCPPRVASNMDCLTYEQSVPAFGEL